MFLERHRAAEVLVIGTIITAALAEWVVTFRERIRSTLPPNAPLSARVRLGRRTLVETTIVRTPDNAPADRGTKRIVVGSIVIAIAAGGPLRSTSRRSRSPGTVGRGCLRVS